MKNIFLALTLLFGAACGGSDAAPVDEQPTDAVTDTMVTDTTVSSADEG